MISLIFINTFIKAKEIQILFDICYQFGLLLLLLYLKSFSQINLLKSIKSIPIILYIRDTFISLLSKISTLSLCLKRNSLLLQIKIIISQKLDYPLGNLANGLSKHIILILRPLLSQRKDPSFPSKFLSKILAAIQDKILYCLQSAQKNFRGNLIVA